MKFIDLFAGLGGFHKALTELNHTCVFASEIDPLLKELYKNNWKIEPEGDIRRIVENEIEKIPEHDILCAGFPCQPFSKAGKQLGRKDTHRGTLFEEIVKILEFRRPKYFILENVPFIAKHDNEATWKYMKAELEKLGYTVDHFNYSPHNFGIPQHRLRIFIVGSQNGLEHFTFNDINSQKTSLIDIHQFIEEAPTLFRELSQKNIECLNLWQEFISAIPKETRILGSPIWGMEFGATYPFENPFPFQLSEDELGKYKGNFGKSLKGLNKDEQFKLLPSYARVDHEFPSWKQTYIRNSRNFYAENRKYILDIVKKIAKLENQSWQKLEWNVGDGNRNIYDYILQFRASGVRVKKVDFFPSLVCTNTQIPIIGWLKRYISKEEGLKLQSLEGIDLPDNDNAAFRALGNAVNSKIVKMIADSLIQTETYKTNYRKCETVAIGHQFRLSFGKD